MIKLPAAGLSAAERFALDLLVDLGRLVPAASTLDVVRLELSVQAPRELRGWMAAGWGIEVAEVDDGEVVETRIYRQVLEDWREDCRGVQRKFRYQLALC